MSKRIRKHTESEARKTEVIEKQTNLLLCIFDVMKMMYRKTPSLV